MTFRTLGINGQMGPQIIYEPAQIFRGRVNRNGVGKGVFAYLKKSCIVILLELVQIFLCEIRQAPPIESV